MKENKNKWFKTKKIVFLMMLFGLGVILGSFWVSVKWIENSVKERCVTAISQYEGDCVEALMQVVDGEDINTYRERNNAIWTLGQIGDDRDGRTTKVIEKYYTGNIPEREPYDEGISQYEMKKALKLLDGGFNITHWFWDPEKLKEM